MFATRRYAVNERVLAIDDSRVVTEDAPLDPDKGEHDYHQDYLGTHDVLMQAPERHINHCCEPNVSVKSLDGIRWVVAYRQIEVGDEIAYDYCINSYGDEEWRCRCGHEQCRGLHHTDFFALPEKKLAEYMPLLDDWFVARYRGPVLELRERFASRLVKPS